MLFSFIAYCVKEILKSLLPYSKYLMFVFLAISGFPRIYIEQLDTYANTTYIMVFYYAFSIVFIFFAENNRVLNKMEWGPTLSSLVIIELYFCILFAQNHFYITIVLLAASVIADILLYRHFLNCRPEKKHAEKYREFCKNKTSAAMCCLLSAALVIPSGIGYYEEYVDTFDLSDWEVFIQLFNEETESAGKPESLFDRHADTLSDINKWDSLNKDERTDLIRKIGLIEEEYLGIKNYAEIIITTEKLPEYEYGYYNDKEKVIRLNVQHICGDPAEENINTILHEVFHAYEHYVVSTLDFESEAVRTSYYYADARRWSENIDNYYSGSDNYSKYKSQPLEADARAHAEARVYEYLDYAVQCENQ